MRNIFIPTPPQKKKKKKKKDHYMSYNKNVRQFGVAHDHSAGEASCKSERAKRVSGRC